MLVFASVDLMADVLAVTKEYKTAYEKAAASAVH